MKLSRSNYRTLAMVGAALALGVGSVLLHDGSAGAASHGVDLRAPQACWDATAPAATTTTTTTAPSTLTSTFSTMPTKSLPIAPGDVIEALTRASSGARIACTQH